METLMKLKEREEAYLSMQTDGSEEYVKSAARLLDIDRQIQSIKEAEENAKRKEREVKSERRDRIFGRCIDVFKAGAGVVLPIIGLVCMTAAEKDITFRGALADYTKLFIPKK